MTPPVASVAVIGSARDPQARRVSAAVERLGAPVFWVDAPAFPESTLMTLGSQVHPPRLRSAYLRGLGYQPLNPRRAAELEARPRGWVAQCGEKRAFLHSWLARLMADGCVMVNPPEANDQHSEKPRQLDLLGRAGLPVPAWLATNDPEAVRSFAADAACVYKPLAGGATVQAVTAADLSGERLEALALAPVLFQRRVEGVALRVYVVGGKVVGAVAIHSESLDYRGKETAVERTALTDAEEAAAVRSAAACGMAFSGVDLIRGREGGCWVLECNPSPMFAALEAATGLKVAEGLAAYLVGRQEKSRGAENQRGA